MKLKRAILTAGVFGAGLALIAAAPAVASTGPQTSTTSTASATARPANGGLAVKSFKNLGPLDQNAHVSARDNGQSVFYGGKSYWFFDDTIEKNPDGFLTSTAAVTSDLNASDNIALHSTTYQSEADTGAPTDFVPITAKEAAFQKAHASADCTGSSDDLCGAVFGFWPGAAVADPAHHRILVFSSKLCRGGPDNGPCASGFIGQQIGAGIVAVDMRTKQATRLTVEHRDTSLTSPEGDDPTLLFSTAQGWGTGGAVLVGNELYTYGQCNEAHACGVARVPVDRVQDRAAWRFYTGQSNGHSVWSTDSSKAVIVMQGGAAGETVHYDPTTHLYMNTYEETLSDQVDFQTSPTPWGPWGQSTPLFTAAKSTNVNYAAFAHPEFTSRDGLTRYYTYYDSGTGAQMLVRVDFTKQK